MKKIISVATLCLILTNCKMYCGEQELINAVQMNNLYEVKRLVLEEKVDINQQDRDLFTPLHASTNKDEILKFLLEQGANPNLANRFGTTPLHLAALRGELQSASLLIDYHATIDVQNNNGHTPLMLAATAGMARLLLDNGANVNFRNALEETPLHALVSRDVRLLMDITAPKIVKLLLERGADINAYKGFGRNRKTPLDIIKHEINTMNPNSMFLQAKPIMREIYKILKRHNEAKQEIRVLLLAKVHRNANSSASSLSQEDYKTLYNLLKKTE